MARGDGGINGDTESDGGGERDQHGGNAAPEIPGHVQLFEKTLH
jgi:hypothetical protein